MTRLTGYPMRWLVTVCFAVGACTAQSQSSASPSFDVASVRPNNSSKDGRSHIYSSSNSGNFRAINVPIKALLLQAYALPETQVLGVPSNVGSGMFDIEAKVTPEFDEQLKLLNEEERKTQKRQMLQALLADRFYLVCHKETRQLPIYALVTAQGGVKLAPSKSNGLLINSSYGKLSAQGLTSEGLARELAKIVGRPVVDEIKATGRFDITLLWTPDEGPRSNAVPSADPPPSIYTAVQEQLGVKLEPRKGPVEVLVVDRLDLPTEN
ncbi:TIGR03435 family protein [Terriglobus saanensis]|uniref:TIGR03435 family protein n=1 Tax=Terriglobus saanensis (strain ATCC BAA-1853 / DSM 23119 / SP1PR4) TaxID=401053 RepID=E8V589_TERSS|nr:TIGR03435 family protein [Terriglobus saanensis]ADV84848.1 hypothetical protein AciPR4_4100 [Terriglobus saanensis SP1PR4]